MGHLKARKDTDTRALRGIVAAEVRTRYMSTIDKLDYSRTLWWLTLSAVSLLNTVSSDTGVCIFLACLACLACLAFLFRVDVMRLSIFMPTLPKQDERGCPPSEMPARKGEARQGRALEALAYKGSESVVRRVALVMLGQRGWVRRDDGLADKEVFVGHGHIYGVLSRKVSRVVGGARPSALRGRSSSWGVVGGRRLIEWRLLFREKHR